MGARRILAMLSMMVAATALGHSGGTVALATLHVSGHTVRYAIRLPIANLPPSLAESTPRALAEAIARHVRIQSMNEACEAVPDLANAPAASSDERTVVLLYACARAPGALTIEDRLNQALGADHHTIATIFFSGGSSQFVFQPDAPVAHIQIGDAQASALPASSAHGDPAPSIAARSGLLGLLIVLAGSALVAYRKRRTSRSD